MLSLGFVVQALVSAAVYAPALPATAVPERPASSQLVAPAGAPDRVTARGELRLRKLHLVRPDLIPYPIAYEVVC